MKRLQIFSFIFLCAILMFSCGRDDSGPSGQSAGGGNGRDRNFGKPEKPQFKIPVTAKKLERDRMYAYLQEVGSIVPIKEVELKPEITARIYYTKQWKEGDIVKEGEIFASMDERDLNLDIQQAELDLEMAKAAVLPAKAQLDQASKDVEFRKAMLERGAISKSEYDQSVLTRIQRENQYEEARRTVRAREMALEKLKKQRESIDIEIPFDGVLLPAQQSLASAEREGNETDLTLLHGRQVAQNTTLCRLADIDHVYASLDVPAQDLMDIQVGQEVELEVYSRVGRDYRGVVMEISTSLNASTRTYTVNVLVDNPEHELRPGMFVQARIITEERMDAIKIPREMVLLRNNRNVVFVAKPKPPEDGEGPETDGEPRPWEEDIEQQPLTQGGYERVAMAAESVSQASLDLATGAMVDELDEFNEDFILPPEAIEEEEREWVAEERVITLGIENRDYVEVVDGLKAGEYLIVLGYETLTDGADISVTIREEDFEEIERSELGE